MLARVREWMTDQKAGDVYQGDIAAGASHPTPSLRLNQREADLDTYSTEDSPPPDPVLARQPVSTEETWIRPLRALVGIVLLAVAWTGLLTMVVLVHNIASMPLRLWPPSFQILFPILELVAAVWVGLVTATSILVSSFLVWLALTERSW